ncbi:MAG TPA: NAD(P)-dependent alcohol dehydrogenase [Rhodanobacteraceae bacterium]|nr:NAD(P)-dependent alcohol dehydrogenase [Rhodanobacteraceae bacterium]
MKAAIFTRYGAPDVIELRDVGTPAPNDDEVRIAVRAASINALDYASVRGTPFAVRLFVGLRAPKETRLGVDVAGVVDAVGGNVTTFKPGDAVFGNCRGAFAESVCTKASSLVAKPDGVTFEEAASLPVASFTALQALRKGNIATGHRVLVNGAAGGVGTFAVQLAKHFGAHVTGVTHTQTLELVKSLGADVAIDYTRDDFTRGSERYDLIVDCHATHGLLRCRRVLKPDGVHLVIGTPMISMMLKCAVLTAVGSRKVSLVMARRHPGDLATIMQLVNDGKVRPVIDRRYRLDDIREAIAYVTEGHARGKVVVVVDTR